MAFEIFPIFFFRVKHFKLLPPPVLPPPVLPLPLCVCVLAHDPLAIIIGALSNALHGISARTTPTSFISPMTLERSTQQYYLGQPAVSAFFIPSKQPSGLRLASTNCWPNVTVAATFKLSSLETSMHKSAIFSVLTCGLYF